MGCPLATCIKDGGRRRPALIGRTQIVESYWDFLVLVGFHLPHGIEKREGRRRRKEGSTPFP